MSFQVRRSFETERAAFMAVATTYNRYTLLLDTYDVRTAIQTAVEVARQARDELGHVLAAVRLDSGDLVADSQYVRVTLPQTRQKRHGHAPVVGVSRSSQCAGPCERLVKTREWSVQDLFRSKRCHVHCGPSD